MKKHSNKKKLLCIGMITAMMFSAVNTAAFALDNQAVSLRQTAENLKDAENQRTKAYDDYESLLSEKNDAENAAVKLKSEIDELESYDIDSKVNSAKLNLELSLKEVSEKKEYRDSLQTRLNELTVEYNKGSFGFFEYVGAEDALDALNNCYYASYTQKGLSTDATSLENMKASFDYIRECNSLRANEGTDPQNGYSLGSLKVSDYMMAAAQADANYSLTNMEHAVQFAVGENLSWGYIDPFTGWYDEEKQEYLCGNQDFMSVGHYLNIVDYEYTVTGFAAAQGGYYGIEHAQTFSSEQSNAMTVDEYEARFMEYYNSITEPISETNVLLDTAQRALIQAEDNQYLYQENYNQLIEESENIKKDLSEKKQSLSDTEEKLSELNAEIPNKKALFDEKESAYQSAKADYDNAVYDNKGDSNFDGEANIADALMVSRYDAGLAALDDLQTAVSDVNNDGEVNIADALMISRYDAGLIESLN